MTASEEDRTVLYPKKKEKKRKKEKEKEKEKREKEELKATSSL